MIEIHNGDSERESKTWDNLSEEELILYDQSTRSGEPWDTPIDRDYGDESLSLKALAKEPIDNPKYKIVTVSRKEARFVENRINGYTLADAYFDAFMCKGSLTKPQAISRARALEKKRYIEAYRENLELRINHMFKEKALWSREQSVKSLRKLINAAENEIEDNNAALEINLELIKEKTESGEYTIQRAMQETANLLAKRRLSKNTQAAITEAVKELNTMFGFDGDHVDSSDAVSFVDYEVLE